MLWQNTNVQEMSLFILLWIKEHIPSPKDSKTAHKHIFPIGRKAESSKNRISFSVYIWKGFLPFLKKRNSSSLDTLSLKDVLDFMISLSCYEKPTINHTMRAVRYYLKYYHENGFIEKERIPYASPQPCKPFDGTWDSVSCYVANPGTYNYRNNNDLSLYWYQRT